MDTYQDPEKALHDIHRSYRTAGYSDLKITCGTDVHEVHKLVVCTQSEFFAKAISFGGQETHSSVINLSEEHPAAVALLIQYLYENEYDPKLPTVEGQLHGPRYVDEAHLKDLKAKESRYTYRFPHSCAKSACRCHNLCPHQGRHFCMHYNFICNKCVPAEKIYTRLSQDSLSIHSKMYQIGDKFLLPNLKNLAAKKFSITCDKFWNEDEFIEAAQYVFSTTMPDDTMRDKILSIICQHIALVKKPEIEILLETHGLAMTVLKQKAAEY